MGFMAGSDNVGYVYSDPAVSIYQRNNLQAHVNISRYGNPAGSGRRTRPPGPHSAAAADALGAGAGAVALLERLAEIFDLGGLG